MAGAGVYLIIRSYRGREFFLAGIGGSRHGRVPNWIARPVMFLMGIGALVLAAGLWWQA